MAGRCAKIKPCPLFNIPFLLEINHNTKVKWQQFLDHMDCLKENNPYTKIMLLVEQWIQTDREK